MSERMKPILGAIVTSGIINYLGVTYFFGPIATDNPPSGAMLPAWASLLVAAVVFTLFFDWVNQQVNHPLKSAMIVAVSQIMLVDVYYVLNGQRAALVAAASAALLLVGWGAVGTVYGKLLEGDSGEAAG